MLCDGFGASCRPAAVDIDGDVWFVDVQPEPWAVDPRTPERGKRALATGEGDIGSTNPYSSGSAASAPVSDGERAARRSKEIILTPKHGAFRTVAPRSVLKRLTALLPDALLARLAEHGAELCLGLVVVVKYAARGVQLRRRTGPRGGVRLVREQAGATGRTMRWAKRHVLPRARPHGSEHRQVGMRQWLPVGECE